MRTVSTKPLTIKQVAKYTYYKRAITDFPFDARGYQSLGDTRVLIRDIEFDDLNEIRSSVGPADLIYVDLPWGGGVTSQFRKRAGRPAGDYSSFRSHFCELLAAFNARHIVLEMGNKFVPKWKESLAAVGLEVEAIADGTYYGDKPMTYMCIGPNAKGLARRLEGVDDEDSPGVVIDALPDVNHVVDLCCGRGTTAFWAEKHGRRFTGVEMDPSRASGTIFHVWKLREEKDSNE